MCPLPSTEAAPGFGNLIPDGNNHLLRDLVFGIPGASRPRGSSVDQFLIDARNPVRDSVGQRLDGLSRSEMSPGDVLYLAPHIIAAARLLRDCVVSIHSRELWRGGCLQRG